jgi:hypothetical protein
MLFFISIPIFLFILFGREGDELLKTIKVNNNYQIEIHRYNCGATCHFTYGLTLINKNQIKNIIDYELTDHSEETSVTVKMLNQNQMVINYPSSAYIQGEIKKYKNISFVYHRQGGDVFVPDNFTKIHSYYYDTINGHDIELNDLEEIKGYQKNYGTYLNKNGLIIGELDFEDIFLIDTSMKSLPVYIVYHYKGREEIQKVSSSYKDFRNTLDTLTGDNFWHYILNFLKGNKKNNLNYVLKIVKEHKDESPTFWKNLFKDESI